MEKRYSILIFCILAITLVLVLFWKPAADQVAKSVPVSTPAAATTTLGTAGQSSSTLSYGQTVSDGVITLGVPTSLFGLATNEQQVLSKSYIPPCDDGFKYCLYYMGHEYDGTNFESAGVSVQPRTDLADEGTCLNTAPTGFSSSTVPSSTFSSDTYSSSVFNNIGDAAAGHSATGSLYRLYVTNSGSCYEFETRVGESDFENYPKGAIQEFTSADMSKVQGELKGILNNISLPSGEKNLFS